MVEEALPRLAGLNDSVLLYLTSFPLTRSTKLCLTGHDDGSDWSSPSASPSSFFDRDRTVLSFPSLEGKRSRDMVTNGEPRRVLHAACHPRTSASIPLSPGTIPPDLLSLPDPRTDTCTRTFVLRTQALLLTLAVFPTLSSPVDALRSQE